MGLRRPQLARSGAVAVAGSIEDDNAIPLREAVHEAVHGKVLDQGTVAMDEHQRLTCPTLEVVQANAIHIEEAADRWVITLGVPRLLDRIQGGCAQGCRRAKQGRTKPPGGVGPVRSMTLGLCGGRELSR